MRHLVLAVALTAATGFLLAGCGNAGSESTTATISTDPSTTAPSDGHAQFLAVMHADGVQGEGAGSAGDAWLVQQATELCADLPFASGGDEQLYVEAMTAQTGSASLTTDFENSAVSAFCPSKISELPSS